MTWYWVALVNEILYVPGTHVLGLLTTVADAAPVPVLAAAAVVCIEEAAAIWVGLVSRTERPAAAPAVG